MHRENGEIKKEKEKYLKCEWIIYEFIILLPSIICKRNAKKEELLTICGGCRCLGERGRG